MDTISEPVSHGPFTSEFLWSSYCISYNCPITYTETILPPPPFRIKSLLTGMDSRTLMEMADGELFSDLVHAHTRLPKINNTFVSGRELV